MIIAKLQSRVRSGVLRPVRITVLPDVHSRCFVASDCVKQVDE